MEELDYLRMKLAESKKRENDLEVRVDELTDFIENAAIPLHWVNGSGVIIWANKAELDLLGYAREDYIGKHISTFHADKKTSEDILSRLINKETLINYAAVLRSKNNTVIPVLINSNVRWDGDRFVHTRCFTRDVSDLRTLEKQKVDLINELQEKNLVLKAELNNLQKPLGNVGR
jgi:two-component system, OmpR family, sensor histidine kinase VicK